MKIQRVLLKDFKVIKDLDVKLDGKSIYLKGDNAKGKSSFMQAIEIALGNSKAIPDNMGGEGKVFTTIDGQPYTFEFATKKGKVELCVTLPDGLKETKKGVIGGIIGAINFDINEFIKKSETKSGRKEQVEEYLKMLPQDFVNGIREFERKAQGIYDERTELGRKMTTLKGFIKESPLFGDDLKIEAVDTTLLKDELEKANAANVKIHDVKKRYKEREAKIESNKTRIEELKKEILELERVTIIEENTQGEAKKWIEKHKEIDTSKIIDAINNAGEINTKAAQAKEHNIKLDQYNKLEESYNDLTVQYETNLQAISDAIKDFDSPVEGLTFDADQLIYNGTPVTNQNLCDSEIIELGIKMKNAFNPELGLIFIENSNLIGLERFKNIIEYAKKYDLQIFMEEVVRGEESLKVEFVKELE